VCRKDQALQRFHNDYGKALTTGASSGSGRCVGQLRVGKIPEVQMMKLKA